MYKQSKVRWSLSEFRKSTDRNPGQPDVVTQALETGVITGINWRDSSNLYPDWRSRLKRGLQCTNPLSGVKCELVKAGTGKAGGYRQYTSATNNEFYEASGTPSAWFSPAVSESSDFTSPGIDATIASNHASRVALRKVREERTAFQGGIFLGELRESVKMILEPAKTLRKGVSQYLDVLSRRAKGLKVTQAEMQRSRRLPPQYTLDRKSRLVKDFLATERRKRDLEKTTLGKVLADTWLEKSFGWDPLISDIREAAIAYGKLVNEIHHSRISAYGKDEVSSTTQGSFTYGAKFPMIETKKVIETCSVRYLAGLKTSTAAKSPERLIAQWFGFSLEQFVPTLWELTPWSFLADYFSNIGDVLEGLVTCQEDVSWVCCTTRKTRDEILSAVSDDVTWRSWWGKSPSVPTVTVGNLHKRTTSVTRNATASIPLQVFTLEVPGLSTKWINMAALIAGGKNLRNSFYNP